jgi:uncharacterized protein (DUF885 family)
VNPLLIDERQALDYHVAMSLAAGSFLAVEHQRPWARDPGVYPRLGIWGCLSLLMRDFAPVEQRAEAMLGRLREIPDMLESGKSNLSNPPSVLVEAAGEVVAGGLSFLRTAVPEVAAQVPQLGGDLLAANERAIAAYEAYRAWLVEDLLPRAHGDLGVGLDVYQQLLFAEHYLTYSPGELVLLAQGVLRETLEEIREVGRQLDPSASWEDLISRLKKDHPPRYGLIDAYRAAIQSSRDFTRERGLASVPSDERLEPAPTPQFLRSTLPYAAYMPPPPFETDRTGYFWVSEVDPSATEDQQESQLSGHCVYAIPMKAVHEGYPGHHLQLVRAADLPSPMRKQAMSTLFIEGWALYCEELMHEQGFYGDPRVRLFQLKDLLWRACRVIIDVGIHTGGMSFEEAVRMLIETAHIEEVNAVAEVKRYIMNPTQPMTYLIGKLLILDLKKREKRRLRDRFDLKEFHDELLSYGSVPIPLIAERMGTEHATYPQGSDPRKK